MKTYDINKTALMLVLGVIVSFLFSGCEIEPYDDMTDVEIYMRNFIKNYGIISPEQDWNASAAAKVTVVPESPVDKLDVYVLVEDTYYLVASYTDVTERVTIPIDVPEGCEELLLVADGEAYPGSVDRIIGVGSVMSRAGDDDLNPLFDYKLSERPLAWLLVAEDVASTDEFDFNDIIVQITATSVNDQKVSDEPYRRLTVRAMAAGGTLPLYLHFKDGNNDYIIGPDGVAEVGGNVSFDDYEWHKWFRNQLGMGYSTTSIINTGPMSVDAVETKSITIKVPADFSMESYSRINYTGSIDDHDYFAQCVKLTKAKDSSMLQGFFVTVGAPRIEDSRQVLFAPAMGVPPQMFLIPDIKPTTISNCNGWMWPVERTDIRRVYDEFSQWLTNPKVEWYLHPNPSDRQLLYRVD